MRREVGEIVGRRMRVDDTAGRDRREADVRKRGERRLARPHRLERAQRGLEACAMVRTDRREVERAEPRRGVGGANPADRLPS